MPPDTIYIPGQTGPPPATGNVYTDSLIQSVWKGHYQDAYGAQHQNGWFGTIVFPLIILVMIIASRWHKIEARFGWERKRKEKAALTNIDQNGMIYDGWLKQYNPYYKSLSGADKEKFLIRTIAFRESKEFCFHGMAAEDYIPVLISGAAVQLTFGLRNYLMDYFDVIHVMRKEYVLNIDKETYDGHVSPNGIHISWNRFLEGYSDYTDSVNVGLHEMAHALQFDAYLGLEDHHDIRFKERLNEFSAEGRPVFRAMRTGMSHLLDDYAMVNFDEFWAVSVETFFENPQQFKERLPRLYIEMCELLNQDPAEPGRILNPALA